MAAKQQEGYTRSMDATPDPALIKRFQRIQRIPIENDTLIPKQYISQLVSAKFIPADKAAEAEWTIRATPSLPTLYGGVASTLERMIHQKPEKRNDVILWTQGDPEVQISKCDSSNLLELNSDEGATGKIYVAAHKNKISELGAEFTSERLNGKKRIIIVEDKSAQLLAAYQEITKLQDIDHRDLPPVTYIWMRRKDNPKTNSKLPDGFETFDELSVFMQNSLKQATTLEDIMPDDDPLENALVLVDVDRVIMDPDKWLYNVQSRLATEFAPAS